MTSRFIGRMNGHERGITPHGVAHETVFGRGLNKPPQRAGFAHRAHLTQNNNVDRRIGSHPPAGGSAFSLASLSLDAAEPPLGPNQERLERRRARKREAQRRYRQRKKAEDPQWARRNADYNRQHRRLPDVRTRQASYNRDYYQRRKATDPAWMAQRRDAARRRYQLKKTQNTAPAEGGSPS